MHYLKDNERVEADAGYVGEDPVNTRTPKGFTRDENRIKIQANVRSRHETVNKRFKQWGCLSNIFRHGLTKHSMVFRCC